MSGITTETQRDVRFKCVRSGNGGEYVNHALEELYKNKGIVHQTTVPYHPEQNGAAERLNRTLMERTRAMLQQAALPDGLWAEAAVTASFLRCRSPVQGKTATPYELFFGKKPDVSMFRVFESKAYVLVPAQKRNKLQSHRVEGRLCGYGETIRSISYSLRLLGPLHQGLVRYRSSCLYCNTHATATLCSHAEPWVAPTHPLERALGLQVPICSSLAISST